VSAIGYLAVGYGLVWLLLAVYLFWLGHRTTALKKRVRELEAHAESSQDSQD
jgi:CcmD family protein